MTIRNVGVNTPGKCSVIACGSKSSLGALVSQGHVLCLSLGGCLCREGTEWVSASACSAGRVMKQQGGPRACARARVQWWALEVMSGRRGGKQEGATRLLTGYRTGDGGEGAGSGSSGARGVNWKVRTWCWRGRGMASGSWGSAATEDDKGKVWPWEQMAEVRGGHSERSVQHCLQDTPNTPVWLCYNTFHTLFRVLVYTPAASVGLLRVRTVGITSRLLVLSPRQGTPQTKCSLANC